MQDVDRNERDAIVSHYARVASFLTSQHGAIPVAWATFPDGVLERGVFHEGLPEGRTGNAAGRRPRGDEDIERPAPVRGAFRRIARVAYGIDVGR